MIKQLIDTPELKLFEISRLKICGREIQIEAIIDLPEFIPIVIVFLSDEDSECEKIIKKIPIQYNAMIFPVKGKIYAAFFPSDGVEKAYGKVMVCMGQIYPDPVYAHEFKNLSEIEDLIKSNAIGMTKKSAIYKKCGKYWYVTNTALVRLNEYFINPQPVNMNDISNQSEKIIGEDAYQKILSYVKGTGNAALPK